jgi:16S rRNA (guanine527-N7)-methyltransferase
VNSREFQERLAPRVRQADVSASPELLERLEIYFRLLATWNEKINLTALPLADPPPETLDRLLIEPLIAATFVAPGARKLMDVGSGGGSPAIPLALAAPQLELLMVESKTRKSVFLREAIRALELNNAEVATARFEQLMVRPEFHESKDLVTLRAVRVEAKVLSELQAFLKPGGQLFLFRSVGAIEPPAATPSLELTAIHPLVDPGRSQLAVLQKR